MNQTSPVRSLARSAMIAAVYAALTMALPVLSYGPVQLRFSEALTVLPFFLPEAIPGLFVGCLLANLLSSFGMADVILGSLATLLAALWTSRMKNAWLAPLPPVISNMVIVGGMIAWFEAGGFGAGFLPAWLYNGSTVALGELAACYVLGMLLLYVLPGIPGVSRYLTPEQLDKLPRRSHQARQQV